MIRALALDDEPLALTVLQTFCARTDGIHLVRTFTSPAEARRFLQTEPVDLLFLDVQMPSETGLAFYRDVPPGVAVILTTAHAEHAVTAFDLQATDYLLKPFTFERFGQALERARAKVKPAAAVPVFTVKLDHGLRRIPLDSILYLEAVDDYLRIHLADGPAPLVRMTLKAAEDALPADRFIRIHRSYLAARDQLKSLRGRTVSVAGHSLPVGPNFEADVKALFAG